MKIIILLLIIVFGMNVAYADEIFITLMTKHGDVIIDGEWTYQTELKGMSSDYIIFEDGSKLEIRTAHDYENIFVFVDNLSDKTIDRLSDKAYVCIDTKNDKSERPQADDYCFVATSGSNTPVTLQGGNFVAQTGFYNKIENNPNLEAVGGKSGEFNRDSKTAHATYEFKIPIEIIGKSDVYGFYAGAFDATGSNVYGWPKDAINKKYPFIPTPNSWGDIISPDKSIPEFNPFLVLTVTLLPIILLGRYLKIKK